MITPRPLLYLLMVCCLFGCATPQVQQHSASTRSAELTPAHAVMADGYALPVTIWQPGDEPRAVIVALHGFNDYRNAFSGVGHYLAQHGIMTLAYDQRGFGETDQRGLWPGGDTLQSDAASVARLVCRQYPGVPLYLLGESMGGAVVISTMQEASPACVAGVILVAPAVWGWTTMPLLQQAALWLAVHTFPGQTLTGEGLEITPSDNIDMLRALGRDPLVIKETRIDAIFGLTNLMEAAFLASSQLSVPALILYGENDEIIPPNSVCRMLAALPGPLTGDWRLTLYPDGYHMLTRDLQAEVVLADMVSWLDDPGAALPSDLEVEATAPRVLALCGEAF
jgi:alpha-beta hydrolase superfamily lysophospholipase